VQSRRRAGRSALRPAMGNQGVEVRPVTPAHLQSRQGGFLGQAVRDACANGAASPGARWHLSAEYVLVNGHVTANGRARKPPNLPSHRRSRQPHIWSVPPHGADDHPGHDLGRVPNTQARWRSCRYIVAPGVPKGPGT
jgi:hypothetical protein